MNDLRPHRRFNPLTGEWILVSPQRATRPWLGAEEKPAPADRPAYDPACYLCPGNERAVGVRNESYTTAWAFDNDFPALLPPEESEPAPAPSHPLLRRQEESGVCRVICFSPNHNKTLPDLTTEEIQAVIALWIAQCEELGGHRDIQYIQIFENKGAVMGCSNPHPHGQLWATRNLPTELEKEQHHQRTYFEVGGVPLLVAYLAEELRVRERILIENDHFVALVPYWATWPFETMVLPKRQIVRLTDLSHDEQASLAALLQKLTRTYDRLFQCEFPYSMGVHQAPYDGESHDEWQLHLHFYPPLLRSASVKKFLVGYEMMAQAQRDLTAEQAAARLRELL